MKSISILLTIIVIATSIHAQNVGVGTALPSQKMQVAGNIRTDNGMIMWPGAFAAAAPDINVQYSTARITLVPGPHANVIIYSATATEGQVLFIANEHDDPATFVGTTIPTLESRAFMYTNGTWRPTSCAATASNDWALLGNATTNPAVNFIETTDAQDFVTRTNSTEWMRLTTTGHLGIGTPTPIDRLEVAREGSIDLGMHFGWNKMVLTNKHNMGAPNGGGHSLGSKILFRGYKDAALITPQNIYSIGIDVFGDAPSAVEKNNFFIRDEYAAGTPVRMLIDGTGNVGIGTSGPGGQFELSLDQGRKPGTNTWTVASDARLKVINGLYTKGLAEVLQLNPIRYNYIKNDTRNLPTDQEFIGFTAQEVKAIFPEAVTHNKDGFYDFNLHSILIAYTNAIKELNSEIQTLKAQNKEMETLKTEVQQLKALFQNVTVEFSDKDKIPTNLVPMKP